MCYLCEALLAGSTDFRYSGDDFTSSPRCHHLGGQDGNRAVTCRGEGLFSQSNYFIVKDTSSVRCVLGVPAPPCRADMGMVLMMVVPGLDDPGAMPRMVDLAEADPA